MNWISRLERKYGRFCIPNLISLIVGGQILVYAIELFVNQFISSYLGLSHSRPGVAGHLEDFFMKQPFCAPSEALRRVLDAAAALPRPETETVPLDEAGGRIAAGTLSARMDQPPFDRSPFDGYALHSADTAGASRETPVDRKSTRLNSSHASKSRMPSSA